MRPFLVKPVPNNTVGTIAVAHIGPAPRAGKRRMLKTDTFLPTEGEWLMHNWRDMDRAEVEAIASGRITTSGRLDVGELGSARAELVRRDQEYAEQQEQIRQEFEREMERNRIEREKNRQEFDAALARENREAAREAAGPQTEAPREAVERQIRIGRLAVWAAVASAFAAMFAVAVTIIQAIK